MTGERAARRPLDPMVAGLADGASAGYRALDSVVSGLQDSLLRQATRPAYAPGPAGARTRASRARRARAAAGPPAGAAPGQSTMLDLSAASHRAGHHGHHHGHQGGYVHDVLGVLVDVLGEVAHVAAEVADELADMFDDPPEHDHHHPHQPHLIQLMAPPGLQTQTNFVIWNTGQSLLSNVVLSTSTFTGPGKHQHDPISVSFQPDAVPPIPPGGSVTMLVTLHVAPKARLGVYRGLIHAHAGDAWAVIELTVAPIYGP